MLEIFTSRARKVLDYAKYEATKKGDDCVGTQHILLGLVKEGSGIGHHILTDNGITIQYISEETDKIVFRGDGEKNPTWTPRAKKAFEHAVDEAKALGHSYVGTEHLLLGILKEGESIAIQILTNYGLKTDELRKEVLELLGFFDKDYQFRPIPESSEVLHSVVVVENGKEDVIGRYEPSTDKLLFNRPLNVEEILRVIRVLRR